jgi:hypothetical protein
MEQQIDNINNLLRSQLHYSQHVMCTIEPYSYQPIFISDRLLVQLGKVAKCVTTYNACELGHVSACHLEHQLIDSPDDDNIIPAMHKANRVHYLSVY